MECVLIDATGAKLISGRIVENNRNLTMKQYEWNGTDVIIKKQPQK